MPDAPSFSSRAPISGAICVNLDKATLRALLAFVSREPGRINLTSIVYDRGRFIATDGHAMLVCDVRELGTWPKKKFRIPVGAYKAAYKAAKARSTIEIFSDGRTYDIAVDGESVHGERICDDPAWSIPWENVIPDISSGDTAANIRGLNPELLGKLAICAKAVPEVLAWRFYMAGALDPILVRCSTPAAICKEWTVVNMPFRI